MNSYQHLAVGLNVNLAKVNSQISQYGLYEAARILGYDTTSYDNLLLAGKLAIQSVRESTAQTILAYAELMRHRLLPTIYNYIVTHHIDLQAAIDSHLHLDYEHDWFSANSMLSLYSLTSYYKGPPMEIPSYTWMRIAIHLYHKVSLEAVIETYIELAEGWYTPASPIIFNAGTTTPYLASCFLMHLKDNFPSIYNRGHRDLAILSKGNGGIGLDISLIRHSEIGDKGMSDGILPMLQGINDTVRYANQLGNRKGAATVFIRPHHIDTVEFVNLRLKVGDRYSRAHDLNTCLWTSWLFWKRVETDDNWTLFCPAKTKQLNSIYGSEFEAAYIKAEQDPTIKYKTVVKARDIYNQILSVQRNASIPSLMNADACNLKSNHRHLGYIACANLCLEIVQYTSKDEIAVCFLHSLSLRMFVKGTWSEGCKLTDVFDFKKLGAITAKVVSNMNRTIDTSAYPLDKYYADSIAEAQDVNVTKLVDISDPINIRKYGPAHLSSAKHRAIAIGVSGFAETLHSLDLCFEDSVTGELNKLIFACIYFNALARSIQLAILFGPYSSFTGSPFSEGKLQFDLWAEEFKLLGPNNVRTAADDIPVEPKCWLQSEITLRNKAGSIIDVILPTWADLKRCGMKYGYRNSLLTALMPTASVSQIRRNCETVEAHQTNLYSRQVLNCGYPVLNRYLVKDLELLGLWTTKTREYLLNTNGSIAKFSNFVTTNPEWFPSFDSSKLPRLVYLERKYKTMWELSQKLFLTRAAERARYIDQSQSTNIFIADTESLNSSDSTADHSFTDKVKACHLIANKLGLKTIMYYLRQQGAPPTKFTVDQGTRKIIEDWLLLDPAAAEITATMTLDSNATTNNCTDGTCCT